MFSLHTVASIVNLKSHLGNVPPAKTFLKNWKQAVKCLFGKNSLRGTTKQWPRQTEFLVRTWSWILQSDFGDEFLVKFSNWISIRSCVHVNKINFCVTYVGGRCAPLSNSRLNKTYLLFYSTATLFIRFFAFPISLWFSSRVKQYFPGSLSLLIYLYQTKLH